MLPYNSFQLQWGEFQENSASVFKNLHDEDDFKDVTLVSDDEKQIDTHKFLLSSSSGFFKRMLSRNLQHRHPVIYLKGVSHLHLEAILKFIYLGQVQVQVEEIGGFLQTARDLDIKGLDQVDESSQERQPVEKIVTILTSKQNIDNKIKVPIGKVHIDSVRHNILIPKIENVFTPSKSEKGIKYDLETLVNITKNTAEMIESVVDTYECKLCDKAFTTSGALCRHRKSIHEGLTFKCDECGHSAKRVDHLNKHKKTKHSLA